MRYASITRIETYLPKKKITNSDLENIYNLTANDIERRTGIKNRFFMGTEDTLVTMAVKASLQTIRESEIQDSEIERIFFLFETPPQKRWDSIAGRIQYELKKSGLSLKGNNFVNIPGGCSEYVDCLKFSTSLIESGRENNILVITSSDNSVFLDTRDVGTSLLFGDGASATLIQATTEPGFIGFYGRGIGEGVGRIYIGPDSCEQGGWKIRMDGKAVYRFAVTAIEESVESLINNIGIHIQDIDKFIFHQANKRIIDYAIKKLSIPEKKVYNSIEKYGNTGVSSIGITLNDAIKEGQIRDGDKAVLVGFGAGLKLDSALFIYHDNPKVC